MPSRRVRCWSFPLRPACPVPSAATTAHCSHVNHVSTQLPYAITAAACSAVCYVITGIAQAFLGANGSLFTSLILLAVAIVVELAVLSVIRVRTNKKAAE